MSPVYTYDHIHLRTKNPQATIEFLQMITDLNAEGVTVLLSSHLLDQVQRICSRVALFQSGRPVGIFRTPAGLCLHISAVGPPQLLQALHKCRDAGLPNWIVHR